MSANNLFVIHYAPGPGWQEDKTVFEQNPRDHGAYMQQLHDAGQLVSAVPSWMITDRYRARRRPFRLVFYKKGFSDGYPNNSAPLLNLRSLPVACSGEEFM